MHSSENPEQALKISKAELKDSRPKELKIEALFDFAGDDDLDGDMLFKDQI